MRGRTLVTVLTGGLSLLPGALGQQPLLQLQGQPFFDGSMTLHVTAPSDIGDLVWMGVGLDPLPLDAPVPTNKGPWYIGTFLTPLLLGTIQSNGRLDLPFTMPPATPGVEGTVVALQAYVAPCGGLSLLALASLTGDAASQTTLWVSGTGVDVFPGDGSSSNPSDIGADETEY